MTNRINIIRRELAAAALALAVLGALTPWIVFAATQTLNGPACSGNWSSTSCWNGGAGPVPVTGDDVVIGNVGVDPTNYDLGASVQLHSIAVNVNFLIHNINGGPIVLQSGGSITDNGSNGLNLFPGVTLNGPTTFSAVGSDGLQFNGAITGTGPLTLTNTGAAGNPQLSSTSDTWTGGTTISGTSAVAVSGNGVIPTGSAVTVNSGATLAFGGSSTIGSLSGAGTVSMSNGGTLTVGGDNTSTTFSGVYQDGNGGSASLTKTGTGTLTLSGTNTYSNNTTIGGGTLNVSADSNLGAASATITFNGGTLQYGAGFSSARGIAMTTGGGTIDTNGSNATLSGMISGFSGLTKIGSGTLILDGNSPGYSGSVAVNGGTLELGDASNPGADLGGPVTVGAGGTLSGHGTISALGSALTNTAGGIVAPGGSIGTLSDFGNYTQGATSTLQIEVSPTGASKLAVTGSATLAGTLAVVADAGVYTVGTTYTIVTAGGSGVLGTFNGLPNGAIFSVGAVYFSISYTSGAVILTVLAPPPAITSAATANGTYGSAFSYTIMASNSPLSYSLVAGTLPTGVTLGTGTNVISGTPTQTGTFNVTVGATNGTGTGTQALAITIAAKATLTVTASGGTRPYGAANSLSYSVAGFTGSDTIAVVSGAPSLNSTASLNSPPGTYQVTASLGSLSAAGYTFTFVSGTMTVVKSVVGMGVNGITPGVTATPGQSFVVSFLVVGALGAAAPSGTISYTVDGGPAQTAALGNATASSNATASVTIAGLAVGTHGVLNSYNGDGNYLATTPTPLTLTVMKGTSQLAVAVSPGNTEPQGQNFTLNFAVTGTGATTTPTGTVSCTVDGGATPQTATIAAGSASLTLSGLAVGTHTVACTYSGDSNYGAAVAASITLTVQQATPAINAGGVVSAAGVNGGVSPGGLMSLFGTSLQSSTTGAANALSEPLPITLGGTQVLVNGASAPLLYVSPAQINCQAPYETPVGTPVQVVVVANGVSSQPLTVTFSSYAPTVFLYPRTATSIDPVIAHANNTLVTPTSPAQPGEVLVIYGTGAGKLNNQPLDGAGAPVSPLATTVATPTVTVGGAAATVQFSGLTPGFAGLLQINVQMPAVFPASTAMPPSLPLVITFPGSVSAPVNLWVQ